MDPKITLHPAGSASKLVYYATILHANELKVAALLDSDAAGDQAAQQEVLVHRLGNARILRTRDVYSGTVPKVEIEELLRDTLVAIARDDLGWYVTTKAAGQPDRPIVELFNSEIKDFSKYRLAKAFLRWSRDHSAADLTEDERSQWAALFGKANKATK